MTHSGITRETIIRLLSNMSSHKEIKDYLKRFSRRDTARFAVVKVGGSIIQNELKDLASSLNFLQQLGLAPIVIHGAGPQLDLELDRQKLVTKKHEGLRVTSDAVLKIARKVIGNNNLALVDALQSIGCKARSVVNGVFECTLINYNQLGFVGNVDAVDMSAITSALDSGSIPIIACLGETSTGQIVNINADMAAIQLVLKVQPYKIVFLTGTGGLLNSEGHILPSINLRSDYKDLLKADSLHSGMRLKLTQINEMLNQLPLDSSVSITNAKHLPRELFTHQGSGTLIRRGEVTNRFKNWEDINQERLTQLIETSFQQKLSKEYFLKNKVQSIYITGDYRAVAIISMHNSLIKLDKFVVSTQAQGEGLARALWRQIRHDNPTLAWRANPNNAINTFYFEEADGFIRTATWNIFWYGIASIKDIEFLVTHLNEQPASLSATPSKAYL